MGRQGTSRGDVSRRLGAYTRAHRQRRRWLAGLVVAAAAVVLCTVCALTVPASTLTWDQVDGGEEQAETTEDATVQTASATEDETSAGVATTLPDGASVPEGYTQTFTYEDTDKGYAVSAYAAEGVVPEGATLKASLLSEGEDAYTAAVEALAADADDESDYGFAALDIRFEDAEGNEVEPSGDVYVVINADGLLPDDADPSTVAVQHLAEDESGAVASVDAVADAADATDGVVSVSDGTTVQAAFAVDSFSTFTITWRDFFTVTVHYVDASGNEIQGQRTQGISISNNQRITFADYVGVIEGYTYSAAHYGSVNGDEVTHMVASLESRPYIGTTRYLTFYDENDEIAELDDGWFSDDEANVYLVYTKDNTGDGGGSTGGGSTTTSASVTTGKTAVLREDGDYDLTLSISGDRGSETTKVAVNVLFILDNSGSMDFSLYRDSNAAWNENSRMDLLKDAVDTLVTTIEDNDSIEASYAAVAFARSQTTTTTDGWVNAERLTNYVGNLDPDGGTNYQQGIYSGKQLLNSADSNAITFVIFISDGEPTYRGVNVNNSTGSYTNGNGQNDNGGYNIAAAVTEIRSMSCNYFYAIGMGPEFTQGGTGMTNLRSLANAVQASNGTGVYSATDEDSFTKAFEDITSSITFFAASDVTITDPLSNYADIVLVDGSPRFTITVTRATYMDSEGTQQPEQIWTNNGSGTTLTFKDADGNDVTLTAKYDEDTKTITLDFPNEYELEEGYTYSISTVITPSEAAITAGMNSDAAKQTPDTGTGTHATNGENGFWSNDNDKAKVTYTANGEYGLASFPKPVIQVQEANTGDLSITKEVSGATLSDSKDYTFTISTTVDMSSAVPTIGDDVVTFNKDDYGTWTAYVTVKAMSVADNVDGSIAISGLPLGTYTVTEITDDTSSDGVGISGYRFDGVTYQFGSSDTSSNPATVELSSEATTATVNVTNKYTQVADITVTKVDAQDTNKKLSGAQFYLTKTEDGTTYYYKWDETTKKVNWVGSQSNATLFTSSDETGAFGTFTIYGLEDGTYYLLETTAPDGYQKPSSNFTFTVTGGKVASTSVGAGLYTDNTLTITNTTGTALPETGGSGTTWFTFGGVALIAAAACGYGFKRSRERRDARS